MPKKSILQAFRLLHLYLGVFITPALIFFAFTGALQTFGLHETNRDHPNYTPAKWIAVLAQIHKKQVPTLPQRRPQPPASATTPASAQPTAVHNPTDASPGASPSSEEHHAHYDHKPDSAQSSVAPSNTSTSAPAPAVAKHNPLPLRLFFLIVSLGLLLSTFTGLYMSYTYTRNKLAISLTLLAGIVLPLLLLAL